MGLDNLVIHPFDKKFSNLSAEEFVKTILVDSFNLKKIIIGYDHRFGNNRAANIDDLISFGKKYDFEVEQISAQEIDKKGLTYANTQVMINAAKIAAEKINLNLDQIDLFIIDQSPCTSLRPQIMMPKADSTSACVAAASILAKNYRDSIIKEIGNDHPEYLFDEHKGYINKVHVEAVKKYGLIDGVHRKSYVVAGYNKPKQINMMDIFDENDQY
jgi:ribonuclease HII